MAFIDPDSLLYGVQWILNSNGSLILLIQNRIFQRYIRYIVGNFSFLGFQ